jgi:hypothetical protein
MDVLGAAGALILRTGQKGATTRSTSLVDGALFADQKNGRSDMANHLTPEELSKERWASTGRK